MNFHTYSQKDAFDDGWYAFENGESIPDVNPYNDDKLFQSFKNGYRSRKLRQNLEDIKRNAS